MLELGVIGALTVALVEFGKRKFPDMFSSDVNALWTVLVYTLLNVANAAYFGGEIQAAVSAGIVSGLATAGLYRTVSGLSKARSIDMSDQVHETIVTTPAELRALVGAKDDEDEGEPIGFKTK